MKTTETNAATKIEVMNADQWESLMATSTPLTPKQIVLAEFEKLKPEQFIIIPIPAAKENQKARTQEQFAQDISVFLSKKKYDAKKKMVRKHPTDETKIVVRRLA